MALLQRIVLWTNGVIALLAAIAVGLSSYYIYTYGDGDGFLWDRSTYLTLLLAGLLALVAAVLGIYGIRDPERRAGVLFIYWFLITVILLINYGGLYLFVGVTNALDQATSGELQEGGTVSDYLSRELQDYVLSIYTTCCLDDENCLNATTVNCTEAPICADDAEDGGLGQGCYTLASVAPSYEITSGFCNVLENFDDPFVGPVDQGKCGGGNSTQFQRDVLDAWDGSYLSTVAPWTLFSIFMTIVWLGATYYNACPKSAEK